MVPSALRTLSVAVLLVAVSGTAIATAPQSPGTGGAAGADLRAAEQDLTGRIALTGGTTTLAASPVGGIDTRNARIARSASAVVDAEVVAEKKKAAARKAAAKKAAAQKAAAKRRAQARARASRTSPRSAKAVARLMVSKRGWKSGQYTCLVKLWDKESNWRHNAQNRSSGAYGIPQSLPGSKMSSAGKDWRSNPSTQIKWGLRYIQERYGSPCSAWAHSRSVGWY
ncbi:hypothetical protein Kisp02_19730 [Kineosporia sp. NBRC 101731]|nr:hypothetical protein Kisp02_19730 [Kineosporia sp. NBRC 101731]